MIAAKTLATRIVRNGSNSLPAMPAPKSTDVVAALSQQERTAVEELINRLFREIRNARPAWRQAWPTKEALASAKVTWVLALVEGEVRDWDRQIEAGLRRLRAEPSDFVPSPGKFVEWCRPTAESLGLQSAKRAYGEACCNAHPSSRASATWSHPATYHAAIDVGLDVLMQLPGFDTWKLFERSYAVMVQRVMDGEALGSGVLVGIGCDSQKSVAQLAEEYSLQFALRVREAQGLLETGSGAREALLSKLRIKR
jgi:hypothetical protein